MICRFAPLAALALAATPVTAQDAAPPPLSPLSVEVLKLDTVLHSDVNAGSICCAPEMLVSGEAEDFVYIKVVFDVAWSEEVDRVSYSGSQAQALKLPGVDDPDAWLRPWGQINWYPAVDGGTHAPLGRHRCSCLRLDRSRLRSRRCRSAA